MSGESNDTGKKRSVFKRISFYALLLAIASLVYTYCQNRELDKLSYKSMGLEYRPQIKLIHKGGTVTAIVDNVPKTVEELTSPERQGLVTKKVSVTTKVLAFNDSPHVAKVMAKGFTDVPLGSDEIRKRILNEEERLNLEMLLNDSFYTSLEILPYTEHSYEFTVEITQANAEKKEFVVHFLILYGNEVGNIYDSYLWLRFKFDKANLQWMAKDGKQPQATASKEELSKFVHFHDKHFSTYMYAKPEAELIRTMIEDFREEQEK